MKHVMALGSIVMLILAGCATPLTPRESGALTGAGFGAATGAILGGIAGSAGTGAAIGAGIGAVTGALAGDAIQAEQNGQGVPTQAALRTSAVSLLPLVCASSAHGPQCLPAARGDS